MAQFDDDYQSLKEMLNNPPAPKPSYEEVVADLTETVHVAASLRQTMLDAGFHAAFANQVANQFLWQSLGLIIIEDKP